MSILTLLYICIGINGSILFFNVIRELSFYIKSEPRQGEVIYLSSKEYDFDDLENYPSNLSEMTATIAFQDDLKSEILAKVKFRSKSNLSINENLKVRVYRTNPSKIKVSSFFNLFEWTIFWSMCTGISVMVYVVMIISS